MIASEETDQEGEAVSDCVGEDLSHSFEVVLKDLPEVVTYIKRLNEHIKRQQDVLLRLYEKLKEYKTRYVTVHEPPKATVCEVATQTEYSDFQDVRLTVSRGEETSEWNSGSFSGENLAEEVKKAAESAMQQTGFVYEATSGMYYDYNSGLYYNAELGLYYDGQSGTYLYYNEDTKCYFYHSKAPTPDSNQHGTHAHDVVSGTSVTAVNPPDVTLPPISHESTVHTVEVVDPKAKTIHKGEIRDCVEDMVQKFSQLSVEALRKNALEVSAAWPPCMRIIVQNTDVKSLSVGTLFIVTCKGGTLGREKFHAVCIPDINISKHHGKFSFDEKDGGKYFLIDYGSRNGTYVNKKRLSAAKQESEPYEITHGTIVTLGSTDLLCHIHPGRETCEECEPGVVAAKIVEDHDPINPAAVPRENKSEMRKQELKRLRKRFGLESNESKGDLLGAGYEDRAEIRRSTVGSQSEHAKTESASVSESIKSSNKGFEMLSKMGWKQGDSLGKDGTGLTEPVLVSQRADKAGLGADNAFVPPDQAASDPRAKRKVDMWLRAQHRYDQISHAGNGEN